MVFGRPALAVPIMDLQACARINLSTTVQPGDIRLVAPAISLDAPLSSLSMEHPLALACRLTIDELGNPPFNAVQLNIKSEIPPASGMGSGAAVSVAIIRTLSQYLSHPLPDARVNDLAFQVEKIHHGTPSGIDNTVITYSQPFFFIRGQKTESFNIGEPFLLLIADTGKKSPTSAAVSGVRRRWKQDQARFEKLFDRIGEVTTYARSALAEGNIRQIGMLMNQNQLLLDEIGVSSPENNRLTLAATRAGAWGAKLSGGGLGGNIIAIAPKPRISAVRSALLDAGAAVCYQSEVA